MVPPQSLFGLLDEQVEFLFLPAPFFPLREKLLSTRMKYSSMSHERLICIKPVRFSTLVRLKSLS